MKNTLTMDRIKERQKLSWQGVFYGIQRIDLLIISISGAGIYVCLETMKFIKENNLEDSDAIKTSGMLLLVGIGLNFLSQIYGRKSNYYDFLWCEEKLDIGNNEPTEKQLNDLKDYDDKSDVYSKYTNRLTNASTFLMMLGLIFLMSYFFFIF